MFLVLRCLDIIENYVKTQKTVQSVTKHSKVTSLYLKVKTKIRYPHCRQSLTWNTKSTLKDTFKFIQLKENQNRSTQPIMELQKYNLQQCFLHYQISNWNKTQSNVNANWKHEQLKIPSVLDLNIFLLFEF